MQSSTFMQILDLIFGLFADLISTLKNCHVMPGLSIWAIFIGLIFMSAIISVFWRGAKG